MLKRAAVLLAAAAMPGACTTTEITHVQVPITTAVPSLPSQVRPGAQRVMTIERLYAWCEEGEIRLQVSGMTNTGGWRDPYLNRVSVDGGIVTYEMLAIAPRGRVNAQVMDTLTVRHAEPAVRGVTRVRVIAQANEMQGDLQLAFACWQGAGP